MRVCTREKCLTCLAADLIRAVVIAVVEVIAAQGGADALAIAALETVLAALVHLFICSNTKSHTVTFKHINVSFTLTGFCFTRHLPLNFSTKKASKCHHPPKTINNADSEPQRIPYNSASFPCNTLFLPQFISSELSPQWLIPSQRLPLHRHTRSFRQRRFLVGGHRNFPTGGRIEVSFQKYLVPPLWFWCSRLFNWCSNSRHSSGFSSELSPQSSSPSHFQASGLHRVLLHWNSSLGQRRSTERK